MKYEIGLPQAEHPPVADAAVRIEVADGRFLESTTAVDGTVSFLVDASQGPFDLTFAKPQHSVISLVGITQSVGDVVMLTHAWPMGTATGTISGRQSAGSTVVVDMPVAASIETTTDTYSTNTYLLPTQESITALEIDAAGKIVGAVMTAPVARDQSSFTADLALAPTTSTTATITVELPSLPPGVSLTKLSNIRSLAACPIPITTVTPGGESLLVGCGRASLPSNNTSTVTVETLTGTLAPQRIWVGYKSTDSGYQLAAFSDTLTDGATLRFPATTALELTGTSLDTVEAKLSGSGWAFSMLQVTSNVTAWFAFSASPDVEHLHLPNLPSSVTLAETELGGATTLTVTAMLSTNDAATPWGQVFDDFKALSYSGVVSATGR